MAHSDIYRIFELSELSALLGIRKHRYLPHRSHWALEMAARACPGAARALKIAARACLGTARGLEMAAPAYSGAT